MRVAAAAAAATLAAALLATASAYRTQTPLSVHCVLCVHVL